MTYENCQTNRNWWKLTARTCQRASWKESSFLTINSQVPAVSVNENIHTTYGHGCWTTKFEPGKWFWFKYIVSEWNETSREYNVKSVVHEVKGFLVKLSNASKISKNKDILHIRRWVMELELLTIAKATILVMYNTSQLISIDTDLQWLLSWSPCWKCITTKHLSCLSDGCTDAPVNWNLTMPVPWIKCQPILLTNSLNSCKMCKIQDTQNVAKKYSHNLVIYLYSKIWYMI